MRHRGLQQRRRIGEAGGLHDHALERGAAIIEIAQELLQRGHEIAAQVAAQAAARQHHHVAVDLLDQQMVERDVAEFVDDDGGVAQIRVAQQPVQQRGLAGAEKAGEQRQRDRRRRTLRRGCRSFAHRAAGCAGCAGPLRRRLGGGFGIGRCAAGRRFLLRGLLGRWQRLARRCGSGRAGASTCLGLAAAVAGAIAAALRLRGAAGCGCSARAGLVARDTLLLGFLLRCVGGLDRHRALIGAEENLDRLHRRRQRPEQRRRLAVGGAQARQRDRLRRIRIHAGRQAASG